MLLELKPEFSQERLEPEMISGPLLVASPAPHVSTDVAMPYSAWRASAARVAEDCEQALWSGTGVKALLWLYRRGLRDDTIRSWHVGFCERDCVLHGLQLHRGIVIPGVAVNGQLLYLKVRRAVGEPDYVSIAGSRAALVGRLTSKDTLLLAATELDAMYAHQEAGDMLDVATLGIPRARSRPWLPWLGTYRSILLAHKADDADHAARRTPLIPRARWLRLPLDAEKEPENLDDATVLGKDLRALLRLAIYVADRANRPNCEVQGESETRINDAGARDTRAAETGGQGHAPRPSRTCSSCGSDAWWERPTGGWICGVCHPNPIDLAAGWVAQRRWSDSP